MTDKLVLVPRTRSKRNRKLPGSLREETAKACRTDIYSRYVLSVIMRTQFKRRGVKVVQSARCGEFEMGAALRELPFLGRPELIFQSDKKLGNEFTTE
jgi:hypothetical protein